MKRFLICLSTFILPLLTLAQTGPPTWKGKFEQLGETLPTPNEYRSASGAPGSKYWQQRADYLIDVEIDEPKNLLRGKETITYYNNSPD